MKKFIGIGFITLLSFSFFSCGTSKIKAQSEHPFKVLEATYTIRIGNQPELALTTLNISTNNPEIQLDSIYFRNHSVPLKRVDSNENIVFTGSFTTSNLQQDYILNSDPRLEFGNKPPVSNSKTPLILAENEAVVSYFYKGKISYYKILEMKKE